MSNLVRSAEIWIRHVFDSLSDGFGWRKSQILLVLGWLRGGKNGQILFSMRTDKAHLVHLAAPREAQHVLGILAILGPNLTFRINLTDFDQFS